MDNQKLLGKITKATFGRCGYQDCQFGLKLSFEGSGWFVAKDICGGWGFEIPAPKGGHWTETDREKGMVSMLREVDKLLVAAKKDTVEQLKGVPVEVEFDAGNQIKGFRVLTEVL